MHKFYYSIRKALNDRLLHIIILKRLNIFQHQQIFVIHRKTLWHFIAIFIFYFHFLFSFYFILYKNWRSHLTKIKVSFYLQLKCCYCKYSYLFGLKNNVSSKGRRVLLKQTVRHPRWRHCGWYVGVLDNVKHIFQGRFLLLRRNCCKWHFMNGYL